MYLFIFLLCQLIPLKMIKVTNSANKPHLTSLSQTLLARSSTCLHALYCTWQQSNSIAICMKCLPVKKNHKRPKPGANRAKISQLTTSRRVGFESEILRPSKKSRIMTGIMNNTIINRCRWRWVVEGLLKRVLF